MIGIKHGASKPSLVAFGLPVLSLVLLWFSVLPCLSCGCQDTYIDRTTETSAACLGDTIYVTVTRYWYHQSGSQGNCTIDEPSFRNEIIAQYPRPAGSGDNVPNCGGGPGPGPGPRPGPNPPGPPPPPCTNPADCCGSGGGPDGPGPRSY